MSETTETAAQVKGHLLGDDHLALTVVHHPDASFVGAYQALPKGEYAVGRESSTLFPGLFDHKRVSRAHATLRAAGGTLSVHDLGSRNGTYVNGERVERGELSPGDSLRIGPVVLVVHRGPRHYDEPASEVLAGTSYVMSQLVDALEEAGRSEQPVMLIGETGVGKELAAKLVHEASGRSGPLVPVNCGALADGVMASELFGHVRGAFSGADIERRGLVDEAQGGTLFLDEIGSASPALQSALLRLLENREYRVVGDSALRIADVRFVAATHPGVRTTVQEGGFRSDLWYRLAHQVVDLPPLRAHREDIPAIVERRFGAGAPQLSPELVDAMMRHPWPGNVRELIATVDRWTGDPERVRDLSDWKVASRPEPMAPAPKTKRPSRDELLDAFRRRRASVSAVAKAFGVSRKSVYRWVETLEIDLSELRDGQET